MPPARKPTVAEHWVAVLIIDVAGVAASAAAIWCVLKGIVVLRRDGIAMVGTTESDGLFVAAAIAAGTVAAIFTFVGLVAGAIAAWEWLAWAWKTPPDRELGGFDGEEMP